VSERRRQAQALLDLCRGLGVPADRERRPRARVGIAADGVHLGRDDGDPGDARARLPEAILGVSCYDDPGRALAAADAGADYVGSAASSLPPPSPWPCARTGRDRRGEAPQSHTRRAIGGITPANAAQAVAAGADMLAVISSLFDAPDVTAAARALSRPFDTESHSHVRTQPAAL